MTNKNDRINSQCQEVCDELEAIRKRLKWSMQKLLREAFNQMEDEEGAFRSEEEKEDELNRHYDKYKKVFKRKKWEQGKARQETLDGLKKIQEAVFKTREYQVSSSFLRECVTKPIKEGAGYLDKKLKSEDHED